MLNTIQYNTIIYYFFYARIKAAGAPWSKLTIKFAEGPINYKKWQEGGKVMQNGVGKLA